MTPTTDPEVMALLDRRVEACRAKDIDGLMALYAPTIVYYDVVPPVQFTGTDEVRRNFLRWFDEYDGPIGLETHELEVATSGDVAFAHMLHLDSGERKEGRPEGAVWVRSTVCCQRSGGRWSITHEHISLPIGWQDEAA
ncbi:nuclear transport factor 2 family protein [Kibdelosporangium persicum]|uniref:Ketosteroid isomerase n=1 Tax=Kibdelosporangium persicum TaxID=2698649 RepID=A0ABX2FFE2_9PSEU|nr:nuclear transport factor 2 family protein [Kibdelosporangium persicum]NRN70012.1 Ketosteroid isomerase [Kibdelosporangium persicum]